jgi:hypothetical protein
VDDGAEGESETNISQLDSYTRMDEIRQFIAGSLA